MWDASFVLLQFLARHPGHIAPPRRCIELGAGTGLGGVGCALLGADIAITDLEVGVQISHDCGLDGDTA